MATITWTSAVAGNWNTGANWSGGVVPGSADDVVFDGTGLGDCTLDISTTVLSLNAQAAYTGTFSLSTFTLTVSGNAAADSNLAVSAGTLACQGDVDIYPLQASGGTLTLNGSAQVLTLGANGVNVVTDLNIDGSTVTSANDGASRSVASGAWVVNNGGSFTNASGLPCNSISVGSSSFVSQTANSTTVGTGGVLQNDGYINIASLTHSNNNGGSYTWAAGDYRDTHLTLHGNNETHTFGAGVVKIKSLTINASRSARSATIANTTNNPSFEFSGNVNLNPTTGTIVWNAGTGTITLAPTGGSNVNFNSQTVDAIHVDPNAVGPILLTGNVTTSWFRDCAGLVDVNGFTLTYDNVDRCAVPYNPTAPPTLALKSGESINTGLVAWWALTDGSGSSPADISGNSETLTNGGSSEWGVQSVGNVAVTNNNTGAYYSTDSAFSTMIGGSTPATDPWTISFWVSTYLLGATYSERGILSIGGSSADGTPFLDVQHSGTTFRFFWAGPGGWTNITGVSHREWANVTISFDGTTCSVYTDGTLGGSRTATGTNGSTSDKLWIGTGYDNTSTVPDTYIQNVRVWNTALTAQQVSDIYTTPWLGSNYEEVVAAGNTFFFPAHFGGRL